MIPKRRREFPKLAAHLADFEITNAPARNIHRLTLERQLQARLEQTVKQHVQRLGKRLSAAMIVVDNDTGDVLARVGSAGYFDARRFGAIDMTRALRSPGSALKPIAYGLAFEMGLAHPETLIDDRPVRFGTYAPKNFDKDYRGSVTVREALGQSLNVPAVKILDAVGPGRMVGRLTRAGIATTLPDQAEPSLAVVLGGIGIRLEDIARIYVALARGGEPIALRHRLPDKAPAVAKAVNAQHLLSATSAYYITSILKDAPPPDNAKAGRIAYKTGTSYGYRDAWAAGYDGKHTIVVWVGRPDAASTPGLTGRTAAAPVLFDAFQRISARRTSFKPAPPQVLAGSGASLPEPLKRFERSRSSSTTGSYLYRPLRIAFPPDRSEVGIDSQQTTIVLKASGGALPLTWFADGAPIAQGQRTRQLLWQQAKAGFVKLSVVDANGRTDGVTVRLRRHH